MNNDGEFSKKDIYHINDSIDGYVLKEQLGKGQTFRAVRVKDSRDVVVKFFLNSLRDEGSRKIYESEIKAREIAKDIPGILKILDWGENNDDNLRAHPVWVKTDVVM